MTLQGKPLEQSNGQEQPSSQVIVLIKIFLAHDTENKSLTSHFFTCDLISKAQGRLILQSQDMQSRGHIITLGVETFHIFAKEYEMYNYINSNPTCHSTIFNTLLYRDYTEHYYAHKFQQIHTSQFTQLVLRKGKTRPYF